MADGKVVVAHGRCLVVERIGSSNNIIVTLRGEIFLMAEYLDVVIWRKNVCPTFEWG